MINSIQVNGCSVFYDGDNPQRYVEAIGKNYAKFRMMTPEPLDDTTADAVRFTTTVVEAGAGDTVTSNSLTAGEGLKVVTAANEYDGINLTALGENFKLVAGKPLSFHSRLKIDDATQSDLLIGILETKTDNLTGGAHTINAANVEGLFFYKVDGGTTITAKSYKDGVQSSTANVATAIDTAMHDYDIFWDGTTVFFYFDGVLVTSTAASLPDGDLTPTLAFRAGSAAARTLVFASDGWDCFQIR
jgi:hypothetical protein